MRALFLFPIAIALSGCARWVVFGHDFGAPGSERAAQQQPVPPQSATAPSQPTDVAPFADQPVASEKPPVQPSPGPSLSPFKGVTVTLTLPAQEKAAADRRFKEDAVIAAIESELRARKLLAEDDATAERTVAVVIDDFATRPTSNAVIFGHVMGEGTLTGIVNVRASSGRQLQTFRITAKSRLVTPASGEDNQALRALYSKFANLAVNTLSGTSGKPDDVTNNEAPR
jgi:hypothetical protein